MACLARSTAGVQLRKALYVGEPKTFDFGDRILGAVAEVLFAGSFRSLAKTIQWLSPSATPWLTRSGLGGGKVKCVAKPNIKSHARETTAPAR